MLRSYIVDKRKKERKIERVCEIIFYYVQLEIKTNKKKVFYINKYEASSCICVCTKQIVTQSVTKDAFEEPIFCRKILQ